LNSYPSGKLTDKIVNKAKSLGATVAGIACVESLKMSPSHSIHPIIGMNLKVPWQDLDADIKPQDVIIPSEAVSAVVIGVRHNANEPELDWWDGKGTPGNRILMRINRMLSQWIEHTFSIKTYKLPYMIEKGGIFLKDAAVLAGLGSIGSNNLVITPGYGPRIRFRALLLNREAEATGPLEFNPCKGCNQPCRKACPIKAFEKSVYSADKLGQSILPGINGTYDRATCNMKMEKDIEEALMAMHVNGIDHQGIRQAIEDFEEGIIEKPEVGERSDYCVKYCRECELACPIGK